MPSSPESNMMRKESKLVRALWALPLLAVVYGAQLTMGVSVKHILPLLRASAIAGKVDLDGRLVVPLYRKYFGSQGLDGFISAFVAFFTPNIGGFDAVSKVQGFAFLGDIIPIQVIWLVEGVRRGNYMTAAHLLPTILGLLFQIRGLGFIAPIWFFLHYVQSPLENYSAPDDRLCQIRGVKTIIPTIMVSYVLPSIAMTAVPDLETRQWINGLFWQAFPLYAAVYQRVFGLFVRDTTEEVRTSDPQADMPYLRQAYGFAAIAAAIPNLMIRFTSPFPLKDVFFQDISDPSFVPNLMEGAAKFLRYDQIATFTAGSIWILLSFSDLKKAGKLQAGWLTIIGGFGATTLVAGPGAALVGMWAWREESLAARKQVAKKED